MHPLIMKVKDLESQSRCLLYYRGNNGRPSPQFLVCQSGTNEILTRWFWKQVMGQNILFSWINQQFMLRWNTQMGGSPCVFNVKEKHWLVKQNKIYGGIFLLSRARARYPLTIQVMTPGVTQAWIVIAVGNKCSRYIIIWAMSLETWYSQLCRWVMLERNRQWL